MRSRANIGSNVVWYDDEWYERMAARIRAARRKAGWTQEYLAGQIGINVADLSKLELNKLEIRLHHLRAISRVLGTPMSELVDTATEAPAHQLTVAPPAPEPWVERIIKQDERKILRLFRKLKRKEKIVTQLLAESMIAVRQTSFKRPKTLVEQVRNVAMASAAAGRNPFCTLKRCHCHLHLGRLSETLEMAHKQLRGAGVKPVDPITPLELKEPKPRKLTKAAQAVLAMAEGAEPGVKDEEALVVEVEAPAADPSPAPPAEPDPRMLETE